MKISESYCVDCGLPCLGKFCPNHLRTNYYCNKCEECAKYQIEDNDYCESCANEYLQQIFNDLSIAQKTKILDLSFRKI